MPKVEVNTILRIKAYNAPEGSIGYIRSVHNSNPSLSSYLGKLVLRTYRGLVDLKNPSTTWDVSQDIRGAGEFELELLPKGSTVTLTVE